MGFWTGKTVAILGGTGFLGKRLTQMLKAQTDAHLVVPIGSRHDLRAEGGYYRFCIEYELRPHVVFHLAATVAGIGATSTHPVDFLYDNTRMGLNVLEECAHMGVAHLVVAGSVCAYPERSPMPMQESHLWGGYPEPTNAAYGLAKRTILAAQQAYAQQYGYISTHVLMANLYGPGQTSEQRKSHVIPAIITKVKAALEIGSDTIELWGTGNASRDFLYVDDAARAYIQIAEKYHSPEPVNIGSGEETSILALAHTICGLMGFKGRILWDASKPDGQPRRCLRLWRIADTVGWKPTTKLTDGLQQTITWYLENA